ncbi:MAG: ribosome biogenesis GTP-binding protein YihA/YsxC [Bacteroidales bacterium]|jgi:GTP-binding protein|nr:ribosome biogenesis GTP-binding protein YihA/YsxC [Bacteroidales bacterium]
MIQRAEFIISSSNYKGCPETDIPEFAFIGRSNVGKSSLLNMLAGNNSLAKISSKPGKTRLINHFSINGGKWFMVDLPGYGYAAVSKTEQAKFTQIIRSYLLNRKNLCCIFVLVDTRLEPQNIDLDFMEWAGKNNVPFAIVGTKSDKSSKTEVEANINALKKEMLKTWAELPPFFITSSNKGTGREEIVTYIETIIESIKQ